MKRKIGLILLGLLLIGSTAYAAGNAVSVYVNGQQVQSGQLIDGSTMLPLRAVAEALGADVQWDGATHQARITMPQPAAEGLSLERLNKIGESVGIVWAYDGDTAISQGSGFVVNGDTFVTNYHVVEGADRLDIRFADKQVWVDVEDALFSDPEADLFGVTVTGFPSLALRTDEPQNGETVYALGYPASKFTITEGRYEFVRHDGKILHSALVRGGNSGGALIDINGNVIGVNSSASDGSPDWNFAIPARVLQSKLK